MKKLITLTSRQIEAIQKEADEKQISFSEMLRRILDQYIEEEIKI